MAFALANGQIPMRPCARALGGLSGAQILSASTFESAEWRSARLTRYPTCSLWSIRGGFEGRRSPPADSVRTVFVVGAVTLRPWMLRAQQIRTKASRNPIPVRRSGWAIPKWGFGRLGYSKWDWVLEVRRKPQALLPWSWSDEGNGHDLDEK